MQISNYLKKDGRGQQELTPDLNTIKQDNNMSLLQNIKRGVQQRPQRVIIYGPEGVGKSTLAAGLPAPVLLDTEQGSSHIDVAPLEVTPTPLWSGRNCGGICPFFRSLTRKSATL